jgi:tetratricopeptide (TPR) repeat protein
MMLQPGIRPLADYPDYELIRKLGAGAFGEVWHARGPGGVEVALKFIRLDPFSVVELRSLEVMKGIRHPNLVSLFGAWHQSNWLILAMELCDRSLQDRLAEALNQKGSGIPVDELLNYMSDAANGLDALSVRHVQHRDVKPANLLLLDSRVKVADFGLAKVLEQTVASNSTGGTVAYMAPECFRGSLTPQSDQYSLAVTYYHLRTGHLLFPGNQAQVMYAHLEVEPDLSHLPRAERIVLARALTKESGKRWRNCTTFVDELREAYKRAKEEEQEHGFQRQEAEHRRQEEERQKREAEAAAPKRQEEDARKNWAPAAERQKRTFVVGAIVLAFLFGFAAVGSIHVPTNTGQAVGVKVPVAAPVPVPPQDKNDQAIRLDPMDADAYLRRGNARAEKKDYDQAIRDYDEAIRLDPNYALAYYYRGFAWSEKQDYDQAIRDYNQAIRLNPNYAFAYLSRGLAWGGIKDHGKAIRDFDQAIRLNPNMTLAYYVRGSAWMARHDYGKAINDYNQVIRLDPNHADAYLRRGIARAEVKDYGKAIIDFDQASRLEPKNALAYLWRGNVWMVLKVYDKAIRDYDEAIRLDPKCDSAYTGRRNAWQAKQGLGR